MTLQELAEGYKGLTDAAQSVIDNWEKGDLAEAVRNLDCWITCAREQLHDWPGEEKPSWPSPEAGVGVREEAEMSRKTNIEVLTDYMSYGSALRQAFVMEAIGRYAEEICKNQDAVREQMKNSFIAPEAWIDCANDWLNVVPRGEKPAGQEGSSK